MRRGQFTLISADHSRRKVVVLNTGTHQRIASWHGAAEESINKVCCWWWLLPLPLLLPLLLPASPPETSPLRREEAPPAADVTTRATE
jgi:hypothetical protein